MKVLSNYFKYFLLLTLFNIILSLSENKDNFDLEKTVIDDNYIGYQKKEKNENLTLDVLFDKSKDLFLSIKTFDKDKEKFNISFQGIDNLNKNGINEFRQKIDKSNFNGSESLYIDITSEQNITLEIINIVDEPKNNYALVKDDNKTQTIKYINFASFLRMDKINESDTNNNVNVVINFNEEVDMPIYYSLIRLSSNNSNYIPRVYNFKKEMYKKEDFKGKQKIIDMNTKKDIISTEDNKNYKDVAFIFSLEKELNNTEYNVSISIIEKTKKEDDDDDGMNYFLIGSIILALFFAVITFFLIRRKKNINEKNVEDDFYKEESKEEEDKN